MKVLVTGGAGFIGSNFIRYIMHRYPNYEVINVDLLNYAGNLNNLRDMVHFPQYKFIRGDITNPQLIEEIMSQNVDVIINFAAESHVDRSIKHPEYFVKTNIIGTQTLLEAARKYKVRKFIQISTDEVYGSLDMNGFFTEETPLAPNSPYSASKASADLLVRSYFKTYGMPVIITRCSNNFGPYQFPEKLIPFMITRALEDQPLPIYGDGRHIRDWLHVEDHCSALDLVMHMGKAGEIYNIGGTNERANFDVVKIILSLLNKPESLIQFVQDRPGHDRRYAIDAKKIRMELGWRPKHSFEKGITETIRWYKEHMDWWKPIIRERRMADDGGG